MNTSAPLAFILGGWYPYFIAHKKCILDIVPVDYVCNAMIIIGAGLLNRTAASVYQLSSSYCNPCYIKNAANFTRKWHKKHLKQNGKNWLERHIRAFKTIKLISPDHYF